MSEAALSYRIQGDYNPLIDSPPGPVGYRAGRTARDAAIKFRALLVHQKRIPLTLRDTACLGQMMSAFEFIFWVAAEAGCSWEEGRAATAQIAPELFADYWLPGGKGASL